MPTHALFKRFNGTEFVEFKFGAFDSEKLGGVLPSGYALAAHTHSISDVLTLQTALDDKANATHTHITADITSGSFSVARGGTGRSTLTANTVLVGNGTTAVTLASRSGIDSRTAFPVADGSITNAKLANVPANTVKGRTSTTGAPVDLTATQLTALVSGATTTNAGKVFLSESDSLQNDGDSVITEQVLLGLMGTSNTKIAFGNHTHGNITSLGAIGTTANLVAVTTTSGVLTTQSRSGIDSRTAFPTTYANITGTVPTWNQNTTGNATTASVASLAMNVNLNTSDSNTNFKIPFANHSGNTSNAYPLLQDSQSGIFTYNPFSNTLGNISQLSTISVSTILLSLSSGATNTVPATMTANSLTSGNALSISSTSTLRSNSLLDIISTGGSSSSSTPIGAKISVTNSHPGSNTALQLTASGSANNTALNVTAGNTILQAVTATTFSGSGASLTSLNASNISSGTLAVPRGGTGATTHTFGNVLIGAGTGAITSLSRTGIDNRTAFPVQGFSQRLASTIATASNTTPVVVFTTPSLPAGTYAFVMNGRMAKSGTASSRAYRVFITGNLSYTIHASAQFSPNTGASAGTGINLSNMNHTLIESSNTGTGFTSGSGFQGSTNTTQVFNMPFTVQGTITTTGNRTFRVRIAQSASASSGTNVQMAVGSQFAIIKIA